MYCNTIFDTFLFRKYRPRWNDRLRVVSWCPPCPWLQSSSPVADIKYHHSPPLPQRKGHLLSCDSWHHGATSFRPYRGVTGDRTLFNRATFATRRCIFLVALVTENHVPGARKLAELRGRTPKSYGHRRRVTTTEATRKCGQFPSQRHHPKHSTTQLPLVRCYHQHWPVCVAFVSACHTHRPLPPSVQSGV